MGLYDNYRQTNSTQIPQFAGSFLPEMRDAQAAMALDYDYVKNSTSKVSYMNDNAPAMKSKVDQDYYKKVHGEIQQTLGAITSSPNLEDMVAQTDQLAHISSMKLKPLGDRAMGYQAEVKRVDDSNWSATQKDEMKAKLIDDDERYGKGIYQDPVSGSMVGKFHQGKEIAKAIDLNEWMDKRVKDIVSQKGGGEVTKSNGMYFIKTGGKSEVRLPDSILKVAQEAYDTDPEVQAYVQQQAGLSGWKAGQNPKDMYKRISAPVLDKDGNETRNYLKENTDAALASGTPLREAIESAVTKQRQGEIKMSMFGYGIDKYKQNNQTDVYDMSADPFATQRLGWAHDEAKAKEIIAYTGQGTTNNTDSVLQTPEGLSGGISSEAHNIDRIKVQIADAEADLKTPGRSGVQLTKIQDNIDDMKTSLNASRGKFNHYKQVAQENLEDATRKLYPGQTYSSMQNSGAIGLSAKLNKLYPSGNVKLDNGTVITVEQLAGSIVKNGTQVKEVEKTNSRGDYIGHTNGDATVQVTDANGNKLGTFTHSPSKIGKSNDTENTLYNVTDGWNRTSELNRIKKDADANYKPLGTINGFSTVPDKHLKEMGKLLSTTPITDDTGKTIVQSDLKDIDWSKTKSGTYTTDDVMPVTLVNKDGTDYGPVRLDMSHTDVRAQFGKQLMLHGTTDDVRQMGMDMITQFPKYVDDRIKLNDYTSKTEDGKQFYSIDPTTNKEVPVRFIRDSRNQYIVSTMEGSPIIKTTSKSTAGKWLHTLEQEANTVYNRTKHEK